jgi:hypothetical protein
VIIGFALFDISLKQLFEYPTPRADPMRSTVPRINCYLIDGNNVAIPPRTKPLHASRPMVNGSIPADGGNLLLSAEEMTDLNGTGLRRISLKINRRKAGSGTVRMCDQTTFPNRLSARDICHRQAPPASRNPTHFVHHQPPFPEWIRRAV